MANNNVSDYIFRKLQDPFYIPTHKDIFTAFKFDACPSIKWRNFCFNRKNPTFEFLNREFINAFSNYLIQRTKEIMGGNLSVTILEVGAGNGRLSYLLKKVFERKIPGKIKIVSTDSGRWHLKNNFPLELISCKNALKKYTPSIVFCSWMPYNIDFTHDFRAIKSVKEYILIGEIDGGCCGEEWQTWGLSKTKRTPIYMLDGFERRDLKNLSKHQICRTDEPKNYYHSKTVSFRRKMFTCE